MNKAILMGLPVLAILAVGGLAAAQPFWNAEDLTQEQKDLQVQILEQRMQNTQDRIDYLNGDLTQEQFQEKVQANQAEMQTLMEQAREQFGDGSGTGCPMGENGRGLGMRGNGLMMGGGV